MAIRAGFCVWGRSLGRLRPIPNDGAGPICRRSSSRGRLHPHPGTVLADVILVLLAEEGAEKVTSSAAELDDEIHRDAESDPEEGELLDPKVLGSLVESEAVEDVPDHAGLIRQHKEERPERKPENGRSDELADQFSVCVSGYARIHAGEREDTGQYRTGLGL